MRRVHLILLAAILFSGLAVPPRAAQAGPPSYLLLRRAETPAPPHGGHDGAAYFDARTRGYAYGYFGVCPNIQPQRHFGVDRAYTQWSFW